MLPLVQKTALVRIGGLICLILLFVGCSSEPQKGLPVLGRVPNFTLTDHNGDSFTQENLKGRVSLIHFFFTSCPTICPTLVRDIKEVVDAADFRGKTIQAVSLSVTPKKDTPELLRSFAKKVEISLEPEQEKEWQLLTGDIKEIQKISESLHLGKADIPQVHSVRIVLIDASGQVRGYYLGTNVEDMVKLSEAASWLSSQ